MGRDAKAEREERLRAALRENLRRRKAQARGRKEQEGEDAADGQPAEPQTRQGEP